MSFSNVLYSENYYTVHGVSNSNWDGICYIKHAAGKGEVCCLVWGNESVRKRTSDPDTVDLQIRIWYPSLRVLSSAGFRSRAAGDLSLRWRCCRLWGLMPCRLRGDRDFPLARSLIGDWALDDLRIFILMSRPCFSSSFRMSSRPCLQGLSTKYFHSMGWKTCGLWGTYRPILTFFMVCW